MNWNISGDYRPEDLPRPNTELFPGISSTVESAAITDAVRSLIKKTPAGHKLFISGSGQAPEGEVVEFKGALYWNIQPLGT